MNQSPADLLQTAAARHRAGDLDVAEALYRRALDLHPQAADAWHLLSLIALTATETRTAMVRIRRAIALEPANALYLNSLGVVHRSNGIPLSAEVWFRRTLRCRPDYDAPLANIAQAAETDGSKDRARKLRRLLVALYPDRPDTHHRLALLESSKHAVTGLRRALALHPDHVGAQVALGLLRWRQGLLDEAAARLRTALLLDPHNADASSALSVLERQTAPLPLKPLNAERPRLAIWVQREWHWPILARLAGLLAEHFAVTIVRTLNDLINPAPDMVIGADAGGLAAVKRVRPSTTTVHVCHGLISKNQPARNYSMIDYVCVPSEERGRQLIAIGATPRRAFWVTGYVQMDPLFRRDLASPSTIAGEGPFVLYAPTYNPLLSSATMLGDRLFERLAGPAGNKTVIVKPHPHIAIADPVTLERWRRLAIGNSKLVLVEPPSRDVAPYLAAADLIVSDASSAAFQFLALDRPIIFIDNPRRFEDTEFFDPAGVEWCWRDVGERVEDVDALWQHVDAAFAEPDARAPERRRCREYLFGCLTDGRAAERIVTHVAELYSLSTSSKSAVQ